MKKIVLLIMCMVIAVLLFGCEKPAALSENEDNNTGNIENIQSTAQSGSPECNLPAFEYEFNPHVISKEYVTAYGTGMEECFYRFCDAVLNGENTFRCATKEQLLMVITISRECLPIANEFIDSDKCYVSDGVGHLSYKIGKDELLEEVSKFKAKVTEVITSAVPYEEEDFIIAAQLLTAVAHKDEYDFEAAESIDQIMKIRPYRVIMEDIGICQEIAGEYMYYLLQVGINASICDTMTTNTDESHEWTVIDLDGEHYHVDPTFTVARKDSLAFFCMDDEKRERYADVEFDMAGIGFSGINGLHYEMHDQRFKDLWEAESYTIDHENKIIHITTESGEEKSIPYIH